MQQGKNKSMITQCVSDIISLTEEVEEDRNKLFIGGIV